MQTLPDFNSLDWIILALVSISVVGSLLKGFARETISLGSVIVGILLASWFYPVTTNFLLRFVQTEDIAAILGFVTIFAGCLVAGAIVSFFVHKFVGLAQLRWFDRLLGAAFGLIRGWMIAAVLVLLLTAFPVELANVQEAQLAPYLLVSARVLVVVTPQSLKDRFLEGYEEVERLWREQTDERNEAEA
jgi:membrane protein required for colicin V production